MSMRGKQKRKNAAVQKYHRPTQVLRNDIGQCENQAEYEKLVREHSSQYESWHEHVEKLRKEQHLLKYQIAEGMDRSESTVSSFLKKIPTKREYVIMLAAMLGLDVEGTNNLLTRWAKYQRLYAKNPDDAIWIYILSKGRCMEPAKQFEGYRSVYREELNRDQVKRTSRTTTVVGQEIETCARQAGNVSPAEDKIFRQMVRNQIPDYQAAYENLMRFLEQQMESARNAYGSPNEMFADNAYFKSNYYGKMRELHRDRILPSRTFLIVLGIRLNMDADAIDQLLDMAGMGPLCAKDQVEGAMVFYLEELYCSCPSVFFQYTQNANDFKYYELREAAPGDRLIQWEDDSEKADETLREYIKRRMSESGISLDQDEADRAREFLRLL